MPCTHTDASIWLIQFIKAMRDDKGDMLPNAHLLGFFRRICRCGHQRHTCQHLSHAINTGYCSTKFGPYSSLTVPRLRLSAALLLPGAGMRPRACGARHQPTVHSRQEQQEVKLRKMAEKLLLNQLKRAALDEASQQALQRAAAKNRRVTAKNRLGQGEEHTASGDDDSNTTLAERAAQLARRIAKGKQPALDMSLPLTDADALLAAQLMLEEVHGSDADCLDALQAAGAAQLGGKDASLQVR